MPAYLPRAAEADCLGLGGYGSGICDWTDGSDYLPGGGGLGYCGVASAGSNDGYDYGYGYGGGSGGGGSSSRPCFFHSDATACVAAQTENATQKCQWDPTKLFSGRCSSYDPCSAHSDGTPTGCAAGDPRAVWD